MKKHLCLFLITIFLCSVQQMHAAGWTPSGPGGTLSASHTGPFWGSAADNVFALSKSTIFHFDGSEWREMVSDTSSDLWDIHGISASETYAVGTKGVVIHYDGVSWKDMSQNATDAYLMGVWASAADSIYAVGVGGVIIHFNGTEWSTVPISSSTPWYLYDVWGTPGGDVYTVGFNGTVLKLGDGQFDPVTPAYSPAEPEFETITGSPSGKLYFTGPDNAIAGKIVVFDGTSWSDINLDFGVTKVGNLCVESDTSIYAAGTNGTALHYNGTGWTDLGGSLPHETDWVWKSGDTVFLGGNAGALGRKDAQGWHVDSPGRDDDASNYAVWSFAEDDVYVAGDNGTISHFNGTGWSQTILPDSPTIYALWGTGSGVLYAGGKRTDIDNKGVLFKLEGTTWGEVTIPTRVGGVFTKAIHSVWGVGNTIYLAGKLDINSTASTRPGCIFSYDGTDWTCELNTATDSLHELRTIRGTAADNIWAAGFNATVLHKTGAGWSKLDTGQPGTTNFYAAVCFSATNVYFAANKDSIFHFDGTSWTSTQPSGDEDTVWRAIWGPNSTDMYIASGDGKIMHWDGAQWADMNAAAPALKGISGTGPDDIWAVGASEAILHFDGTTKAEALPQTEQPENREVVITSQAQNTRDTEWLDLNYGIGTRFTPDSDVREFTATINEAGKTGVFGFRTTGKGETVGNTNLVKLRLDGTAITYTYSTSGSADSPDGTWWVQTTATPPVTLGSGDTLTTGIQYDIRFIIKDNGKYDQDPTDKSIHDPLVFGTGPVETGDGSSGSGEGGCAMNPNAEFSAGWLFFAAFIACLRFRRILCKTTR